MSVKKVHVSSSSSPACSQIDTPHQRIQRSSDGSLQRHPVPGGTSKGFQSLRTAVNPKGCHLRLHKGPRSYQNICSGVFVQRPPGEMKAALFAGPR